MKVNIKNMKKFLAKLMFNINIGEENATQFDEQLRVIEARGLEEAFHKARSIGQSEEETFMNQEKRPVSWKFIDVAELYPLEDVKDGEQVYSNTLQISDSDSYINYIRQKSIEIQVK